MESNIINANHCGLVVRSILFLCGVANEGSLKAVIIE